jgi:1-acyl-sn-glycerol-3-phosphate acyltransferase
VAEHASSMEAPSPSGPVVPPGLGRGQQFTAQIVRWPFRWYARLSIRGAEHIPRSGRAIVAANHPSMWDVPLTWLASSRPVVFMAKQGLFSDPIRRWFFDWLGGFPVRRDISDMRALDVARAILEAEQCLCLFAEGTRNKSGDLLPFMKGTAWLALRTGSPIIPCGIVGTEVRHGWRKLLRKRVRVSFGEQIPVEREPSARGRREKVEHLTTELEARVRALLA